MVDKPYDRSTAIGLLVDACRAGHQSSCWKAREVAPPDRQTALVDSVMRNCREKHLLSCRALRAEQGDALPGTMGRSRACQVFEDAGCDVGALRAECEQGFPESCRQLGLRSRDDDERSRLAARVAELALAGCQQDLANECDMGTSPWGDDAIVEALRRRCKLARDACAPLGRALARSQARTEARDAFELACQYGRDLVACKELGSAYLARTYAEPIPGRGQALLDYGCSELRRMLGKRYDATLHPECGAVSRK